MKKLKYYFRLAQWIAYFINSIFYVIGSIMDLHEADADESAED